MKLSTILCFSYLWITAYSITVDHKALILTTSTDSNVGAAKYTLNSYGIPYDVIVVDSVNFNGNLSIEYSDGAGKYSLFILTSDSLAYYSGSQWKSGLSDAKFQELADYQIKYHVRQITMNAWPNASKNYVTPKNTNDAGCCTGEHPAKFTAASPISNAGLNRNATLSTAGIFHYPSVITDTSRAVSILEFQGGFQDRFPDTTVGGVIIKHLDGREEMVFFMSFGDWSVTSLALGHMWVSWGTRGIYEGTRKIYLNTQVDDFFLDSDIVVLPGQTEKIFRLAPNDMKLLATWQKDLNKRLMPGSDFRVELAFNGKGISNMSVDDVLHTIDPLGYVDLNYKKPPGEGDSQWPNPPPNDTSLGIDKPSNILDPLYNHFTGLNYDNAKLFFWLSHTFTHLNLNNASLYDANLEVKTNINVTKNLLGFFDESFFSPHSLVTPQVSGVFNRDALVAFMNNGITNIVGDNSRPNLISEFGLWYPLITTEQLSNYAGYVILPRSPTEIYFHCSTPTENTFVYNTIYNATLGFLTFNDILEREANRVLYKLLSLHPDGYMFHQANLRASDTIVTVGSGTGNLGTMQQWIETVVFKLRQVTTWPIISKKQDDMAVLFKKRLARKNCGITSKLVYDSTGTAIVSVDVVSKSTCEVPFTVPADIDATTRSGLSKEAIEKIGDQPLVVHLSMVPGVKKTIKLSAPVAFT